MPVADFGARDPKRRSSLRLIAGTGLTFAVIVSALLSPGCGSGSGTIPATPDTSGLPTGKATQTQVTRGRYLVVTSGCIDCHNRAVNNPAGPNWLAGYLPGTPGQPFEIGPFKTYPANITSDVNTGIGKFTDRQIYNALKSGLSPDFTPDPSTGVIPTEPHYLAPPMPWTSTRHLSDDDLWAIVAYLKHGTKPVNNLVPESTGPPDNWASSYTEAVAGPINLPAFPAAGEQFTP